MIDLSALREGSAEGAATGIPTDGNHQATLDRADFIETKNGQRLITEWTLQDDTLVSWTSWNRITDSEGKPDHKGLDFTKSLLAALEVDHAGTDDQIASELEAAVGQVWDVATKTWGDRGDQVNTYVNGRVMGLQESLPVDDRDLPSPRKDDAIPF